MSSTAPSGVELQTLLHVVLRTLLSVQQNAFENDIFALQGQIFNFGVEGGHMEQEIVWIGSGKCLGADSFPSLPLAPSCLQ